MRPLLVAILLIFACAVPAVTEEEYVDLGVIVELDNIAYLPTDVVRMRVLVMNSGTATATGVVLRTKGNLEFETGAWGEFEESGPGATLKPGQQVELILTAPPNDPGDGMTQEVSTGSRQACRTAGTSTRPRTSGCGPNSRRQRWPRPTTTCRSSSRPCRWTGTTTRSATPCGSASRSPTPAPPT